MPKTNREHSEKKKNDFVKFKLRLRKTSNVRLKSTEGNKIITTTIKKRKIQYRIDFFANFWF